MFEGRAMNEHLSEETLDQYVNGEAEAYDVDRLAEHVRVCELCARKLQRAARVEEALHEVAQSHERQSASPRRWLAVASLLIVVGVSGIVSKLFSHSEAPSALVSLGEIICPDGDDQASCIRDAHAHGRVVAYPASAGAPRITTFDDSDTPGTHIAFQGE